MKVLRRSMALILITLLTITFVPALYARDAEKININAASAEKITQLKGIGPKYAERIVEYRKEHGPFALPEDITKVPGIGPKTFEVIKEQITTE